MRVAPATLACVLASLALPAFAQPPDSVPQLAPRSILGPRAIARPRIRVAGVQVTQLETRKPAFAVQVVNDGPSAAPSFTLAVVAANGEWPALLAGVAPLARGQSTTVTVQVPQPLAAGYYTYEVRAGNDPDRPLATVLYRQQRFWVPNTADLKARAPTWQLDSHRTLRWLEVTVVDLGPDASPGGMATLEATAQWTARAQPLPALKPGEERVVRFILDEPLSPGSTIDGVVSVSGDAAVPDPDPSNDRAQFQLFVAPLDYDVAVWIETAAGTSAAPAEVRVRLSNLRAEPSPPGEAVLRVDGAEQASLPFAALGGGKTIFLAFVTPTALGAGPHAIELGLRAVGAAAWSDAVPADDRAQASVTVTEVAQVERVRVPDLGGLSVGQASGALRPLGLWLRGVRRVAGVFGANGGVSDQHPRPGDRVARGTPVDVEVADPPPAWWYVVGAGFLGAAVFAAWRIFGPKLPPAEPNVPEPAEPERPADVKAPAVDCTMNPAPTSLDSLSSHGPHWTIEVQVNRAPSELELGSPQPGEEEVT